MNFSMSKRSCLKGYSVNKSRAKHNFGPAHLPNTPLTLWSFDDPIYIAEPGRVHFALLLHLYCWTVFGSVHFLMVVVYVTMSKYSTLQYIPKLI